MNTTPVEGRKAKRIINRLIQEQKITPEGVEWLTYATDPFHDTEVKPVGYPDMNTCGTIVQCFTYTTNIKTPTPGQGFDAYVIFNPMSRTQGWLTGNIADDPLDMMSLSPYGGVGGVPFSGPKLYGGLNVITCDSSTNPWTVGPATTTDALQFPRMGGQYRLTACGFEITDVTPEIYRGGSVTVWRSPAQVSTQNHLFYYVGDSASKPFPVNVCNMFPTSQANAQLIPSTKTWAAKDGAYVIATQTCDENSFCTSASNIPFMLTVPSVADIASATATLCYTDRSAIVNSGTGSQNNLAQILNFELCGAYFVGLQAQSSLQVTVKYYIERIPSVSEPDLLVLTRPPSPYDPLALELYTRVVQELPVGVPVGENPLGEWFNDILGVIASYAPTVGSFFGPEGMLVGQGVSSLAKGVQGFLPKEQVRQVPKTTRQNNTNNNNMNNTNNKKDIVRAKPKPKRRTKTNQPQSTPN